MSVLGLAALSALSHAHIASAATWYWDPDLTAAGNNPATGANLGGAGTWNASATNWYDGANDVAWNSIHTAGFTGVTGTTPATVTLDNGGATTSVQGLAFSFGGYTLTANTSADTLTITGATGITGIPIAPATTLAASFINPNIITSTATTFQYQNGPLTINGDIALGGALTLNPNAGAAVMTVNGAISGNFGVSKGTASGGTTVVLAGANTFNGPVTVLSSQGGGISVGSIGSWRPGNAVASNLGSPTSAANGKITLGSATIAGTLTYTGGGETTNRTFELVNGGGILNNGTGPLIVNDLNVAGTAAKTFTLGGTYTGGVSHFNGLVVDTGGATSMTVAGTWLITRDNTYSGLTSPNGNPIVRTINSVATNVGLGTVHSSSSNLGAPTTIANGTLTIGGGTGAGQFTYIGTGETTDRVVNLGGTSGPGNIRNDGSGGLNFTSNFTATGAGSKTLTLFGTNGGIIHGSIVNNSVANTTALLKGGTGTWTLRAANGYTGSTSLYGGTLVLDMVNNPSGVLATTTNSTFFVGGNLKMLGQATPSSQTLPNPTFGINNVNYAGGSTIILDPNGASNSVSLTLGTGAWTRQARTALHIDTTAAGTKVLNGSPTLTNGALGYATIDDGSGVGFATRSGGGAGTTIVKLTGATSLANNSDSASTNFSLAGSLNMTNATHRVNTLSIASPGGGGTLDLGGASGVLSPTTSGLLLTGGANDNYTIQNGQVGASGAELIIHQHALGTLTISGTVSGGAGTVTKAGPGTLILTNTNAYTGATSLIGGVLEVSAMANIGSPTANSNAGTVLNVNGGTIRFGTSSFDFSSGASAARTVNILDNGLTVDTNGFSQALANPIGGTSTNPTPNSRGSLTKTGAGTLTLNAVNTYSGVTAVNAGTLRIAGTGAINSSYLININGATAKLQADSSVQVTSLLNFQRGTLAGTGKFTSAITIGDGVLNAGQPDATLAPGASIGTLTMGDLTFASDAILAAELDGAVNSTTSDKVLVTGSVTLGSGIADLTASYDTGTFAAGQKYFIVVNDELDAVSGFFSGLADPDGTISADDPVVITDSSYALHISYTGDSTAPSGGSLTGGNDIVLYTVAIPEPSMVGILGGIGMLGVATRRRRKA